MKTLSGLLLAAVLLSAPLAGVAQAEKVDFGKVTCGQFIEFDENTMTMFYFWLDGYVSAKTGNSVIDTDAVEGDLTALLQKCNASKQSTLLKVIGK